MFVPVRIGVNGEAIYAKGFDMLATEAKDMKVPLGAIGMRLLETVTEQFASEGAASGNAWKELTPKYAKYKESKVGLLPLLVGMKRTGAKGQRPQTYEPSGRMRAELLAPSSLRVGAKRMMYIPPSDIAGFHEFGTEKMVARPPVEIRPTELREWDRIFVRWMNGLIVQSGLAA